MSVTFRRFDQAETLKDEEDIQAYLDAAVEDGDPAVMAMALGAVARARNMAQLARDAELTREGLYKALSPGGNPSFGTIAKVAKALGYQIGFIRSPAPAKAIAAVAAKASKVTSKSVRARAPLAIAAKPPTKPKPSARRGARHYTSV